MGTVLLTIKKRLYIFVAIDFIAALLFGLYFDVQTLNIKFISIYALGPHIKPFLDGAETAPAAQA